jgi:hypothetical protein
MEAVEHAGHDDPENQHYHKSGKFRLHVFIPTP